MRRSYELNLDIAHFLEHYWQRRPLLIKGGFKDFQDPISPDELAVPFQFIPGWRLDDVMVSFSTPHADVGPHIENYDVFITQCLGRRHLRVGDAKPPQRVRRPCCTASRSRRSSIVIM